MTNGSFRSYGQSQVEEQARFRKKLRRRCLFVSAVVLIAAVCLGLELVRRSHIDSSSSTPPDSATSSAHLRTIQAACHTTLYPDVCLAELRANPDAFGARPTQLASIAVRVAMKHAREAGELASSLRSEASRLRRDSRAVAFRDCEDLMEEALYRLNHSAVHLTDLAGIRGRDLNRRLADVEVWVTGALSYQTACVDGFDDLAAQGMQVLPNHLMLMNRQQELVMKTIVVAFGLVHFLSHVSQNISTWKTSLQHSMPRIHSRRLPSTVFGIDAHGFPSWMPHRHRRLLESPMPMVANTTQPSNSSISPYQAIVALDGSSQFHKIQDAIDQMPRNNNGHYTIYIKAGKYAENIIVCRNLTNLMLIGDGIHRTEIIGNRNVASGQFTTFRSATVAVSASNFIAKGITFTNRAGFVGHQAVALRVGGDFAAFDTCSFEGYQDTLYALAERQYYRNCEIAGTVDFIFGNAAAIFQGCKLLVRVPGPRQMNTLTAHGRTLMDAPTGFSFQSCHVTAESGDGSLTGVRSFLGRPWKAYSRTVFMKSMIDGIIDPAGWLSWNVSNPFAHTVYYGEYQNSGAGANTTGRVTWPGIHSSMSTPEAQVFTVSSFIDGAQWLPQANINFDNVIAS